MVKNLAPPEETPLVIFRNNFVYRISTIQFPFGSQRNSLEVHKGSRRRYFQDLKLFFDLIGAILNQIYDFHLFALLLMENSYWFASLFLLADIIPALPILYDRLRVEKSWKIIRFFFHPFNILFWLCRTIYNKVHEPTLEAIKIAHVSLEASFQIMLTVTMMSMGILKWPGTYENKIYNAYNVSLDLRWWPVISTIISIIGIFAGTLQTFKPIATETGNVVGYLTFVPIFLFRMLSWQLLIITLERFSIFLLVTMAFINVVTLTLCQKEKIKFDPVNYGFLSLVFPARPLPKTVDLKKTKSTRTRFVSSARNSVVLRKPSETESKNSDTPMFSVSILFWLVFIGNTFLFFVYGIVFGLYMTNMYNPWCNETLTNILFEEELFRKSLLFFSSLYSSATMPIVIVYLSEFTRFCYLKETFKKTIVGLTCLTLFGSSVFFLSKELLKVNFSEGLNSTKITLPAENYSFSFSGSGWSQWSTTVDGQERSRLCLQYILKQSKVNKSQQNITLFKRNWSEWTYSPCNRRCNNGTRVKIRICQKHGFDRGECEGPDKVEEECNTHDCPVYTKMLVVGGGSAKTEIIDTNSTLTKCSYLPDFPIQISEAMGGLDQQSRPLVCGGERESSDESSSCFMFTEGYWTRIPYSLHTKLRSAAITQLEYNDFDLIISGGMNEKREIMKSLSVHGPTGWSKLNTELPVGLCYHCMVQINTTTIFIIGGVNGITATNATYFFNLEQKIWQSGPDLSHSRSTHSCGHIQNPRNEFSSGKSIIVVGGRDTKLNRMRSVEILDADVNQWRNGPALPLGIYGATLVENPLGGVIIVGGNRFIDGEILWLLQHAGEDAEWSEMTQRLLTPRSFHIAFMVPDNVTTCV